MDAFANLSNDVQSDTKLGCLLCKAVSTRVYHLAHLDPARRKSRTLRLGFSGDLFFFFFGLTFPMRSFIDRLVTGRCLHTDSCVFGA